ncbi:hypothetical protein EsH8_X_000139 [Colletotrichum jinshuiense]
MQFMSQSTGWADCILLAMAPIGVVTIIVSAIRVGGYQWLKAVVGRARENIVVAELEVMSSTSHEACELWNGRTVVRCPGAADICEFICIYPTNMNAPIESVTIMDISRATLPSEPDLDDRSTSKSGRYFLRIQAKHWERKRILMYLHSWSDKIRQWRPSLKNKTRSSKRSFDDEEAGTPSGSELRAGQNGLTPRYVNSRTNNIHENNAMSHSRQQQEDDSQSRSLEEPQKEIIIVRNTEHIAPNISLNCRADGNRWHLWVLATISVFIQGGVVFYFGFVTEYPTLRFEKDDQPVDAYAMPLATTSTVLLVAGMLICAHVVDNGSTEEVHELDNIKDTTALAMVWLQKKKKVSDQYFQSAVIYHQMKRYRVFTSKRTIEDDDEPSNRTDSKSRNKKQGGPGRRLKALTATGTFISLLGVGGQFAGLRGMHWTASIAQLGAVVIMTILRALVRRHLVQGIKHKNLTSGFELDWFVESLSNFKTAPWLPKSVVAEQSQMQRSPRASDGEFELIFPRPFWMIQTGTTTGLIATSVMTQALNNQSPEECEERGHQISDLNSANSILDLRRSLGELGNWQSPVVTEARILCQAVEATMEFFAPFFKEKPTGGSFVWSMAVKTKYNGEVLQNIDFHIDQKPEGWRARIDELDAALSLWLYSARVEHEERSAIQHPSETDRWIRGTEIQDRCLRIIGPSTRGLIRDLDWWMPNSLEGISMAEINPTQSNKEETGGTLLQEVHDSRIGRSGQSWSRFDADISTMPFASAARTSSGQEGSSTPDAQNWTYKLKDLKGFRKSQSNTHPVLPLVMESQEPLEKLYMKEFFTSFVWILVGCLEASSIGKSLKAEITPSNAKGQDAWQNFTLKSKEISSLVQSIAKLGCWSEREVYSSLVPPLSHSDNLPGLDSVVDLALNAAAAPERANQWSQSVQTYRWLYNVADTFPSTSYIYCKSVAVLMKFEARMQRPQLRCFGSQYDDEYKSHELCHSRGDIKKILLAADGKDSSLRERLKRILDVHREMIPFLSTRQDAHYHYSVHEDTLLRYEEDLLESTIYNWSVQETNSHDIFNRTALHHAMQSYLESRNILRHLFRAGGIDSYDMDNYWKMLQGKVQQACESGNNPTNWPISCSLALLDPSKRFEEIIKNGEDINSRDLDHWTPLHYVCHQLGFQLGIQQSKYGREQYEESDVHFEERRALSRAQILIRQGANVNAQGLDGLTPLHCAVMSGCLGLVDLLIRNKADVTIASIDGRTPFHLAAMTGNPEVISRFSGLGLDIEAKDLAGRTPLHLAVMYNDSQSIQELLQHGAKADAKDFKGRSLLHLASLYNNTDAVAVLLGEDGAAEPGHTNDANTKDADGRTPLHLAALFDSEAAATLLLRPRDDGPVGNLNATDKKERTPLHLAALSNAARVVSVLMKAHVAHDGLLSWRPRDFVKATPLHCAAEKDAADAIREITNEMKGFLQEESFREVLLLKDNRGDTAFATAVRHGKALAVQAFLEIRVGDLMQCLLHGKSNDGATPLLSAYESRFRDIALRLMELGASINDVHPRSGNNLLHLATQDEDKTVVEYIFRRTDDWERLRSQLNEQGKTPADIAAEIGGDIAKLFDQAR